MDDLILCVGTTFLIIPVSLLKFGTVSTFLAVILATFIYNIQRSCFINYKTSLGIWYNILSYIASVGLVSHALASTLYYIDNLHGTSSLLKSLTTYFAISLISVFIIITLVILCSLGLEKSTVLRTLLTTSICSTIVVLALNTPVHKLERIFSIPPDNMTQVLQATILILAGFVLLAIDNNKQCGVSNTNNNISQRFIHVNSMNRYTKMFTIFIVMIFITLSISFYLLRQQQHSLYGKTITTDITLSTVFFNLLLNKWCRLLMLVLVVLNLGLMLPDLMITCSNGYSKLAGRIFPLWIKKEITLTGTQAICIIMAGFLTVPISTAMTLEELMELMAAGSLLALYTDIIYNINKTFQPAYFCKDSGNNADGGKYEMLTTIQDEDDEELLNNLERGELSDDSGHSSDTDIDAVVAEFKEKIKVATTMADPIISEPTTFTGRRVTLSLIFVNALLFVSGFAVRYNFIFLFIICIVVLFIIMIIIGCQPSRQNEKKISLFISAIYLIFTSVLLSNFSLHIILTIIVWTVFCEIAWCMYNPASNNLMKQIKQMFIKPKRCLSNSSTFDRHSTSSTLTLVDTVHIIR